MKISHIETETNEIEVIDDLICNICQKSLNPNKDKHNKKECNFYGLEEIEITGGYESSKILDMTTIKFSICEVCLFDKVISQFTIPHEVKSEDMFLDTGWIPADKYDSVVEEILDQREEKLEELHNIFKARKEDKT